MEVLILAADNRITRNEAEVAIEKSKVTIAVVTGHIEGDQVTHGGRRLADLPNVFDDQIAYEKMDKDTVVYQVDSHTAVPEGTSGGLFFGTSYVYPGQVGDEYFMTKGHYHQRKETAEYYWGITGVGVLLLMDEEGICRAEQVEIGSLHYIPSNIAHRLINTGKELLTVGACWPSDAGHDYKSIEDTGFLAKVVNIDGMPVIVKR